MVSISQTSLRFGFHGVSDPATQDAIFTITRAATHFPSFIFKNMFLTLLRKGARASRSEQALKIISFFFSLSSVFPFVFFSFPRLASNEGGTPA